jgi:hypothetical protein
VVRRLAVLVIVLLGAGCKITEQIDPPPGQTSVIAQMVLNTASPTQTLLLERSDGATSRNWLTGANVQLTQLTPDASCQQPVVTLREVMDSIVYGLTALNQPAYRTNGLCTLHPGDRVALRIETRQGEVVTGTTRIPGASDFALSIGPTQAGAPPLTTPLDRTRDSFRVAVTPRFAQGLQIQAVRKNGNPRRNPGNNLPIGAAFDITTDTMHAVIAGSLADPFEGRTIFHAGVIYQFAVATTDTNYFDFVRSGDNPLTGRGFINHLTGGIGVFGSVSPQTYDVPVVAPQTNAREGKYRLTGHVNYPRSANVDVTWDLYIDALSDSLNGFSALMDGVWVEGPVHTSVDGTFLRGFHAQFYGVPADTLSTIRPLYEIDYAGAVPPRGTPFVARVRAVQFGMSVANAPVDSVTVVQVAGP